MRAPQAGVWRARPQRNLRTGGREMRQRRAVGHYHHKVLPDQPPLPSKTQAGLLPSPPSPDTPSTPTLPHATSNGTAPPSGKELRRTRRWRRALGFDFVFLQIESCAWRAPSQLRIRKSNRMLPCDCPAPQPRATMPPALRKLRVQGLPCRLLLVSLCRFPTIFHRGRRPPFGPRPGRYELFPFVDSFDALQRGRRITLRPVPGRYDLFPFVDLSGAPQTQAAPASSTPAPAGKTRSTIQCNSNRCLRRHCPADLAIATLSGIIAGR